MIEKLTYFESRSKDKRLVFKLSSQITIKIGFNMEMFMAEESHLHNNLTIPNRWTMNDKRLK